MTRILTSQPGTDAYDAAIRGYVLANRINYVFAKSDTEHYQAYLQLVQDQFMGEPAVDPNDQYRDRDLVPRALEGYARKHGVELVTGQVYFHDQFAIAAVPDAVDGDQIGITVHIRESLETYINMVEKWIDPERGIDPAELRHAQAMMAITGLPYWIHLNYFEDAPTLTRRMREHEIEFDKHRGAELERKLIAFVAKSRFQAADEAAA